MRESHGVETGRGKGTEALAGKGVEEEEEALTEEVVAEVLTEEAGVVLTGVEGVAEEAGVVEEGLTGDEEDVVEVLTGEEEGDVVEVDEAEAGVAVEEAALGRTGPVHHVASATLLATGNAGNAKHPNLRLGRMPT